jgi:FAD:protein FMN transferase
MFRLMTLEDRTKILKKIPYRLVRDFFLPAIFLLVSCNNNQEKLIKIEGKAQGTTYSVSYISAEEKDFSKQIDLLLKAFDLSLSQWNENSIISRINRNDSSAVADNFFKTVFIRAMQVAEETNGAFDPTIAPIVNAWGFGLKNKSKTDSATIDSLLLLVNYHNIALLDNGKVVKHDDRMMLDFNALAQGYSVDVVSEFLEKKGIENYLVEIGGETRAKGKNQEEQFWRIGIDKPLENQEGRPLQAVVSLENKSLATSGNYRKFYEEKGVKYSHTIDPETGYPVRHSLLSATVVASDCISADAYATSFMVIGLEEAKKFLSVHKELDALLIYSDKKGELKAFATEGLRTKITEP